MPTDTRPMCGWTGFTGWKDYLMRHFGKARIVVKWCDRRDLEIVEAPYPWDRAWDDWCNIIAESDSAAIRRFPKAMSQWEDWYDAQ